MGRIIHNPSGTGNGKRIERADYEDGFRYSPEGLAKATATTQEFPRDLYHSLGEKERPAAVWKVTPAQALDPLRDRVSA